MTYAQPPQVSIIVPSYNRAHLIKRCLHNLLCQTYENFEIIVVDDGSDDDTQSVVSGVADPRIRYIRHERNKGLAAARNTGIKAAAGIFIAFQDTDDEWVPDKLSKQVRGFAGLPEDVGAVYGKALRCYAGREYVVPNKKTPPRNGDISRRILEGNFMSVISVMMRKSCFDKIGLFDEDLPSLEDWELWIRMSRSYRFEFIDDFLVKVNFTEDSLTAKIKYTIEARKKILEQHLEWFKENRPGLAKSYAQLAWDSCLAGDKIDGRKWLAKALKMQPFGLRYYLIYTLSYLGVNTVKKFNDIYMGHKAKHKM